MSEPNIDFTIGPMAGNMLRYLALAGSTPNAGESFQLSFQAEFTNTSTTETYHVNLLKISFPAGSGIGPTEIPIRHYVPNTDQTGPDLVLSPGQTRRPVDFVTAKNILLTSTPPATIIFEAFVNGNATPKKHTFALRRHLKVGGVGYRWPWRQSDLRRGEYWESIGNNHCCGPQLYAYDLGIRYFDKAANVWTEMMPGKTAASDRHKNENYRIWGKPIFAMADGVVKTFADGVETNPNPPADTGTTVYGNHFIIDHDGEEMLYAHMHPGSLNATLKASEHAAVHAGDFLGLVGNTGNSTQPHLHIHAVDRTAQMLRPIPWAKKMVTALENNHRARNWRVSSDEGLMVVNTLIYPGDAPPADDQEWSEWESLGGNLTSGPAVASWGPRRLDVFAIGIDRALYHKWFDGSQWHDWQSLGGQLTSRPAAVSWGPNRIDVFARGTNNEVWHIWWDGSRWHEWQSIGGTCLGAPAVSSRRANHLDIFVEATDETMYHRIWNGSTWTPWESLGGTLTSDPAAISWSNNRIDTFVRATDGTLYHRWWNGSTWSQWEGQGRAMKFGPAVCSRKENHLDVFVTAPDGALLHETWNGSTWVHWESLGGLLTEGPAAVSWSEDRIDIFARGTDNAIYHKLWKPS